MQFSVHDINIHCLGENPPTVDVNTKTVLGNRKKKSCDSFLKNMFSHIHFLNVYDYILK